jgi:hypothetical protein
MDVGKWKKQLDKDEKRALKMRVEELIEYYEVDNLEKIIFSELDDLGLRSEYYLDMMEVIIGEILIEKELTETDKNNLT